jgi:3-isopropylmalate/(R)-2-methylmalate dehydratase large subunit
MSQPFVEKVIASHRTTGEVSPGAVVGVSVDLVVSDELSFPEVIRDFEELSADRVFDPDRIAIVADHETPARSLLAAESMRRTREFVARHGISHLYDAGEAGIIHVLVPERGLIAPGELMMGYDSHVLTAGAIGALAVGVGAMDAAVAIAFGEMWLRVPETVRISVTGTPGAWVTTKDVALEIGTELGQSGCLYQAIEYDGAYVARLDMDGRLTLANMAIEMGAKSVAMECDAMAQEYLAARLDRPYEAVWADDDARYARHDWFDVTALTPRVARPGAPDTAVPVDEVAGTHLDQVYLGSCTNGRLSDLRLAADVLRGRKVHEGTRLIVVPGSPGVLRAAVAEGIVGDLLDAGATIAPPGCGPCAGLHLGVLAHGEVCLATSSRNFPGRMGGGEVFLASPAVAASSAVAGEIAGPHHLVRAAAGS